MIKSPRLAFLPLSLFTFIVLAQPASGQTPSGAARLPLWKIQGPKATVHLLGSVHFLKQENYPLARPMEAAFERSKVVVFETDLGAMESPETQMKLLTQAMLPAGQTLKSQISPKLFQQLEAQLKESQVPLEAVQNLKPGMVAMTLALVELQQLGLDPKLGVDQHFHGRAKKAGKMIVGLEPPAYQVDLLTGFSKAEGEAILESTLKDSKIMRKELGNLLKAWQAGDMKSVADLMNKALEEYPDLHKRLIVDRNKNWIPILQELIKGEKDAIVIVGAGHLAGAQSVVELLEKAGVKVVQQ